jgi:hypothetical protein
VPVFHPHWRKALNLELGLKILITQSLVARNSKSGPWLFLLESGLSALFLKGKQKKIGTEYLTEFWCT